MKVRAKTSFSTHSPESRMNQRFSFIQKMRGGNFE